MVTLVWGGGEGVLGEGSPPPAPQLSFKNSGGGWVGWEGGVGGCAGGRRYCRMLGGGIAGWAGGCPHGPTRHTAGTTIFQTPPGGGGDLIRLNEID